MGKKLEFRSVEQVRTCALARFRHNVAFSRLSAMEKGYATVASIAGNDVSPAQLKLFLDGKREGAGIAGSATRERIYKFFAERIVTETQEIDALYDAAKADESGYRAFAD